MLSKSQFFDRAGAVDWFENHSVYSSGKSSYPVSLKKLSDCIFLVFHARVEETRLTHLFYCSCQCLKFTHGKNCQYKAESCTKDGICQNGGICNQITGHCTCPAGYSGHNCQEDINECLEKVSSFLCFCVGLTHLLFYYKN